MKLPALCVLCALTISPIHQAAVAQPAGLACWSDLELDSVPVTGPVVVADGSIAATVSLGRLYLMSVGTDGSLELLTPNPPSTGAMRVDLDGDLACIVTAIDTVQILDISDPSTPVFLSEISGLELGDLAQPFGSFFNARSQPIELIGSTLYTVGNQGLSVFDLSDPVAPAALGHAPATMVAYDIEVRGNRVFVADQVDGLHVFDATDPTNPTLLGSTTGLPAASLAIKDDIAYLASGINTISDPSFSMLYVVDFSDPSLPVLLDSLHSSRGTESPLIDGDRLYVGTTLSFLLYDITDPANPALKSETGGMKYNSFSISGIALSDDALIVSGLDDTFSYRRDGAIDESPAVARIDPTGMNDLSLLTADGPVSYAWRASASELVALDTSDPTSPNVLGTINLAIVGQAAALVLADNAVLVRASNNIFWPVDVTDPSAMTSLGTWQHPHQSDLGELVYEDGYLFGSYWFGGLSVLELPDISSPGSAHAFPFPELTAAQYFSIEVEAGLAIMYAYVQWPGFDQYFVVTIDVSDPLSPIFLDSWRAPSTGIADTRRITPGTVLVLGSRHADEPNSGSTGLITLDISDPSAITQIDEHIILNDAYGAMPNRQLSTQLAATADHAVVSYRVSIVFGIQATGILLVPILPDGTFDRNTVLPVMDSQLARDLVILGDHVVLQSDRVFRLPCGGPACPADLAEPFGTLNFFDVAEYISLYVAGDPAADLAAPFGAFNFFDVAAFIAAYNAGCP